MNSLRRERCFLRNVKKNLFKSYARLKFWILVAILIDFGRKLRFFNISLKLYLVSQFWSKLAEIFGPDHLLIIVKRIKEAFLKILILSGFMLIFRQKMGNFEIFLYFTQIVSSVTILVQIG